MASRYKCCLSFKLVAFLVVIIYLVVLTVIIGTRMREIVESSIEESSAHAIDIQSFRKNPIDNFSNSKIHVAIILCNATNVKLGKSKSSTSFERQVNQTIVLIKSVLMSALFDLGIRPQRKADFCVKFHIIAEEEETFEYLLKAFSDASRTWNPRYLNKFRLEFVQLKYPPGTEWMKKLFRPCATARLFIPHILPDIDAVLYLDTDFIFLRDIHKLWKEFGNFKQEAIAGMSPCLNHYGTNRNKIPYYGKTGLNAGLMLMNLSNMRTNDFDKKVISTTKKYRNVIKLADQDILNIYFHYHADELHELSCIWNFRPFQCLDGNSCDSALLDGIHAIHGNALSFVSEGIEPIFYTIFQKFYQSTALQDPTFSFIDFKLTLAETTFNTDGTRSPCSRYDLFKLMLMNT